MTIPKPTANLHTWFPATVQAPDGTLIRRTRVYVAPEGLYVYTRPAQDADATPNHWWPINWAATPQPKNTQTSAMNGHQIVTDAGTLTVHYSGQGCGCSNPLKKWVPEFAGTTLKTWPDGSDA